MYPNKEVWKKVCGSGGVLIHSDKRYSVRRGGYVLSGVCLSFALSVCLLATSRKTTDRIFMKNRHKLYCVEEDLIKFWKSSASVSTSGNYLKDSLTLWDRAFFILWLMLWKKTDRSLWKFHHRCIEFTVTQNCRSQQDPDSGSRRDSPWRRTELSEYSC